MTRMNRLIGLPVILGEKKIGQVAQVSLSRCGTELAGLTVQRGLHKPKWVPAEQIAMLGDVCVLVDGMPARKTAQKPFTLGKVCDTSGMRLGCVTDAKVDEHTLRVDALEITFGPLDDLLQGRRWVQSFTIEAASGDVVVPCMGAGSGTQERGT